MLKGKKYDRPRKREVVRGERRGYTEGSKVKGADGRNSTRLYSLDSCHQVIPADPHQDGKKALN